MTHFLNSRIDEVGEFDFLNHYLLPLLDDKSIGDDVAYIKTLGNKIVITSDAGPSHVDVIPLEYVFTNQGWLLAIANISDLASAGAKPLGISNSIDIPGEMLIKDCLDFFGAFKEACDYYNVKITGGNIRQRKIFSSHATIFGYLEEDDFEIRRTNIKPGDVVYLLGEPANFAKAYLEAKICGFANLSYEQKQHLLRPKAKLTEMLTLRENIRIIASSDVSDGVLGSLKNLQDSSVVGFELEEQTTYSNDLLESAAKFNIHPLNLFNFWGDWNMVLVVSALDAGKLEEFCQNNNMHLTKIGRAIAGNHLLFKHKTGKESQIHLVRNENFRSNSFNSHITNSIDYMLYSQILH